jgi:hypothetical protein
MLSGVLPNCLDKSSPLSDTSLTSSANALKSCYRQPMLHGNVLANNHSDNVVTQTEEDNTTFPNRTLGRKADKPNQGLLLSPRVERITSKWRVEPIHNNRLVPLY